MVTDWPLLLRGGETGSVRTRRRKQKKITKQPEKPGDMRLGSAADRCLNTWSGTGAHRLLNKLNDEIKLLVQRHQTLAPTTEQNHK